MNTELDTNHSDDLTPAEMAYITSKGEDLSGFEKPARLEGARGISDAVEIKPEEKPPEQAPVEPSNEDDETELTIEIGDDGKPRDLKTGRFVPHGALHKERERRKAVEAENVKMRENFARAEERLKVLNDIIGAQEEPAKAEEEKAIDPEQDIFGAFKQAMKRIEHLQTQLTEKDQRDRVATTEQTIRNVYESDARRFMAEKPEFKDAYTHLVAGRHKELEALGITDQVKRNAMIAQEERGLVGQALQNQMSPAQVIYNLAVARGFQAKAVEEPSPEAKAAAEAAAKKLEKIKDGQQKTQSLSQAGGSAGQGTTLEALIEMSEPDFHKKVGRLSRGQLAKLLGE